MATQPPVGAQEMALLRTKLYIPPPPARPFDWAQGKASAAPAPDRAAERRPAPQANPHLRPGRLWQDLVNDLAATAAL